MTTGDGPGGDIIRQSGDISGVPVELLEAPDVWDQAALRFTPEEVAELIQTNGECVDVAPMHQFETFEEFLDEQNNFWAAFGAEGFIGGINRSLKYFQRFAILHPELYVRIARDRVDIKRRGQAGEYTYDDPWWHDLYDAYKKTSVLVDVNDEYVIRDGRVDEWKLIR